VAPLAHQLVLWLQLPGRRCPASLLALLGQVVLVVLLALLALLVLQLQRRVPPWLVVMVLLGVLGVLRGVLQLQLVALLCCRQCGEGEEVVEGDEDEDGSG
jgi:hypothetical protein